VQLWAICSHTCTLSPSSIGTGVSWEGNRRSGVALAVCWDNSGISAYWLTALEREMTTPPTLLWNLAHFTFPLPRWRRRWKCGTGKTTGWAKSSYVPTSCLDLQSLALLFGPTFSKTVYSLDVA